MESGCHLHNSIVCNKAWIGADASLRDCQVREPRGVLVLLGCYTCLCVRLKTDQQLYADLRNYCYNLCCLSLRKRTWHWSLFFLVVS